jgi:hypothetical protein
VLVRMCLPRLSAAARFVIAIASSDATADRLRSPHHFYPRRWARKVVRARDELVAAGVLNAPVAKNGPGYYSLTRNMWIMFPELIEHAFVHYGSPQWRGGEPVRT